MNEPAAIRPLAVVTGASSGIGFELARCCAEDGYDLLIAADEPEIEGAAQRLRDSGAKVEAVQADLATRGGIEQLYAALGGRPVEALLANAGRGLGRGFLDQDFDAVRRVVDTNVPGTIELLHRVGRDMRARGRGRILITGSIAGFMPGSFQAAYNASKAFIDSFAFALREELKDSGVTVTCLMPGATDTEFFERADMLDTKVGTMKKDDPADVARVGYEAMKKGRGDVVSGLKNKLQATLAHVTPAPVLAGMHRKLSEPGTAVARPTEADWREGRPASPRNLLAGAIGGLVGGAVVTALLMLDRADGKRRPSELVQMQRRAAGRLGLSQPSVRARSGIAEEGAGHGWHLALSAALGVLYAVSLRRSRLPASASGTAFGMLIYPLAHGLAGPALGLTKGMREEPKTVARRAAVHGAFGLATGLATRQAAKQLARANGAGF